ncbi:MAG TPA: hypothetical protein VHO01_00250 [Jatrophihabitans sp.]|nr:hypothetical protein [Jatrophihabitans sp.]
MTILARARRRFADATDGDAGTTLMELLVGMMIMAIFGGIFTTSIVLMTSSSTKAESLATTSSQLSVAFQRLDKSIRYAAAISTPGQSYGGGTTGDWYVEYRTTNTGTERCTQLRVDQASKQLQVRTWTPVSSVATGLSGWVPWGSNITNGGAASGSADVPFTLPTAGSSVTFQQLQVTLVDVSGNPPTTSRSTLTLPALNSTVTTTSTNVCQEAGRP